MDNVASNVTGSGLSPSKVLAFRTALRLLEAEEKKIKALREAIEEGEASHIVEDFDAKEHLEDLHRKHL